MSHNVTYKDCTNCDTPEGIVYCTICTYGFCEYCQYGTDIPKKCN